MILIVALFASETSGFPFQLLIDQNKSNVSVSIDTDTLHHTVIIQWNKEVCGLQVLKLHLQLLEWIHVWSSNTLLSFYFPLFSSLRSVCCIFPTSRPALYFTLHLLRGR